MFQIAALRLLNHIRGSVLFHLVQLALHGRCTSMLPLWLGAALYRILLCRGGATVRFGSQGARAHGRNFQRASRS